MRVKITWRCDDEEFFTTDNSTYDLEDWLAVVAIVQAIEARHTVLAIERIEAE